MQVGRVVTHYIDERGFIGRVAIFTFEMENSPRDQVPLRRFVVKTEVLTRLARVWVLDGLEWRLILERFSSAYQCWKPTGEGSPEDYDTHERRQADCEALRRLATDILQSVA